MSRDLLLRLTSPLILYSSQLHTSIGTLFERIDWILIFLRIRATWWRWIPFTLRRWLHQGGEGGVRIRPVRVTHRRSDHHVSSILVYSPPGILSAHVAQQLAAAPLPPLDHNLPDRPGRTNTAYDKDGQEADEHKSNRYDPSPDADAVMSVHSVQSSISDVEDENRALRVLVVDDAVSNRKMLCRLLRARCRSLEEAGDGVEAVAKVKQSMYLPLEQQFDLVLMDFVMPIMDGPTATEEIRGLGYTGIIFGLTGNVLDSDMELFRVKGANFVLPKPFDVKLFESALADLNTFPTVDSLPPPTRKSSSNDGPGQSNRKLSRMVNDAMRWNRKGSVASKANSSLSHS